MAGRTWLAIGIAAAALAGAAAADAADTADSQRREALRQAARMQRAAEIYRSDCAYCHGETGNGRGTGPSSAPVPDFTSPGAVAGLSAGRMQDAIRSGHEASARAVWGARDPDDVAAVVAYIRETFMLPAAVADASVGRKLYARTCSVCHGDRGNGATWARNGLNPPPLDFTSAKAASLSRLHMLNTAAYGRPGTAMVGFSTQLSRDEIAAVVEYIRSTFIAAPRDAGRRVDLAAAVAPLAASAPKGHDHSSHGDADMAAPFPSGLKGDARRGKALFDANCVPCHGEKGDGNGPRAYFMFKKPADFTNAEARRALNRPHLYERILDGVLATEMPAWSKVLDSQAIADVAEYAFAAFVQAGAPVATGAAPASPAPGGQRAGAQADHDHSAHDHGPASGGAKKKP